jgi:hypothetical protein
MSRLLLPAAALLALPAVTRAGMPMITLEEVPRMRLQTISFFLMVLLLSALCIKLLWNYLGRDFRFLPRLSYGKALGLVALWGLMFVLVLTMISGARELMTPGAWKKEGATYKLADQPAAPPAYEEPLEKQRERKLEDLRAQLWRYAYAHDAQFPPDHNEPNIPKEAWLLPGPHSMPYVYVPSQRAGREATPLAYEPDVYGPRRLVLLTNGEIRHMEVEEIMLALTGEEP